jgi:Excalibur calcium-binding domain
MPIEGSIDKAQALLHSARQMRWTKKRAVIVGSLWAIALGVWGFIWLDAQTPLPSPDPVRINTQETRIEQAAAAPDPMPRPAEPAPAAPASASESVAAAAADTTPETYYANCDAAVAAGAAPIYAGEPGYRSKLDRDGDGVACEQ